MVGGVARAVQQGVEAGEHDVSNGLLVGVAATGEPLMLFLEGLSDLFVPFCLQPCKAAPREFGVFTLFANDKEDIFIL